MFIQSLLTVVLSCQNVANIQQKTVYLTSRDTGQSCQIKNGTSHNFAFKQDSDTYGAIFPLNSKQ